MLNECISPELRSRGWTGGSGKYYLRGSTDHVGSLIISGNPKRSTAHICHFEVHIGVISTYLREFHEETSQPPRAKPSYWSDHDWFSEVARDLTIGEDDDPMTIGQRMLALLDELAIPAVEASLTDEGLRMAVDSCPVGVGRGHARTLMEIGQGNYDIARERIKSFAEHPGDDHPGVTLVRERLSAAEAARQKSLGD